MSYSFFYKYYCEIIHSYINIVGGSEAKNDKTGFARNVQIMFRLSFMITIRNDNRYHNLIIVMSLIDAQEF